MNQHAWWVTGLQFTGLGWYIAGAVVLTTLGGVYLDRWVGVSPLFTLLGVLLGTFLAFYGTYKMVVTFMAGQQDSEDGKGRSR